MDAGMIGILLQQFGIDAAKAQAFIALVSNAGETITGFDARLRAIEDALARIERGAVTVTVPGDGRPVVVPLKSE